MKKHRLCVVLLGIALSAIALPASASHYSLSDIEFVPSKQITALAQMKITSTRTLLEITRTKQQRRELAQKLKVKATAVREWALTCDLLRVRGIGPRMAKLLTAANVNSIKKLAAQTAPDLAKKIKIANNRVKVTENPPGEENLSNWITQAKRLPIVVQE
ncbi:MAG: DUF4332 domain-containing protein [Myxococcales bacterium]|nr:DUF4332 domain-containing protein [Myxococcales bacterium]